MSSELYQGIFIPYLGKPEEIKINFEAGDIRRKLNCELTDHVTLWAENYKLSLFCDDFSFKKNLPENPLATRLVINIFGNEFPASIRGNAILLDDEKKLTIGDLNSLLKATVITFRTEEIASHLLRNLLRIKLKDNFSSKNNSCRIQILCRDVAGKENKSQFKSSFRRICYLGEDMEFADVNDWDFIVVQAKYIHRLKMTKSSGPTLEVLIDGKESLFRDESIINNEKNCNTLCKLLLSADDVCYSEYAFKNDIITKLFENIDKLRRKFNKPSMRQMPYG